MNKIDVTFYKSPFGPMLLGSYMGKLCLADWQDRKNRKTIDRKIQKALKAEYSEQGSEVVDQTIKQLDAYFTCKRIVFDIPLLLIGTEFQRSVWEALMEIPYGKTSSYQELSQSIGNEKAVRAVANANGANAISIIVPCHRIIGSDGSLTGYAGGLEIKKKLLVHENHLFT